MQAATDPIDEGFAIADDGVRLFYRRVGTGPQAVVVPNMIYLFDDFRELQDTFTLIFYDMRNRGRSERVTEADRVSRGVHHDVEDLDAIRRHFGFPKVHLLGHSYLGLAVVLYALRFTAHVDRVVQIGALPFDQDKRYPDDLSNHDDVLADVGAALAELQKAPPKDPETHCRQWWRLIRQVFVADPADADKISDACCALENEWPEHQVAHFVDHLAPSLRALEITPTTLRALTMPVLTVHGRRDRQSPYGAGLDWAAALPDARLLTVDGGAHMPWLEAPERVLGAVRTFLGGAWPAEAVRVEEGVAA